MRTAQWVDGNTWDYTVRVIPELLGVTQAGIGLMYNSPTWYLSAMFIVMLPLSYLFLRNPNLYLYVLAPIGGLFSLSYLNYCWDEYIPINDSFIICIVRAVCGILFGGVAWIIYEKLCVLPENKRLKVLLTIVELILNAAFFYTWIFNSDTRETLFSSLLLIPFIVAIAFSGKSYISRLFEFRFMKYFNSLSFTIFLNHFAAMYVSSALAPNENYFLQTMLMALITAVFSIVNFIAVKIIKCLWEKIKSW